MAQAIQAKVEPATLELTSCSRCARPVNNGWSFIFKVAPVASEDGNGIWPREIKKCFRCAIRHLPMLRRSLTVALGVGTVLALLNHGDILLAGEWKNALYWKIPLTYCVPFCVATFGALGTCRR